MSTWNEANIKDGKPLAPQSYRLSDQCRFCRKTRTAESMTSEPIEFNPNNKDLRLCDLTGGWVHEVGVCDHYKMYEI